MPSSRRDLLHAAGTASAWAMLGTVLGHARAALAAATAEGPAQAFSWDQLVAEARQLSTEPWRMPGDQRPGAVAALTWDQYNAIRFNPDHALWADADLPFQAQFFHLGIFFRVAVQIFEVSGDRAWPIQYDPAMFDYGPTRFDPPLPKDLGFAGFRLHFHTNFKQDVVVFQGASYFRATDSQSHYGLSARGLAIDTGLPKPEEFPLFTKFWLVRPEASDNAMTVYALLESESVTGAYRFDIAPGGTTVMDIQCRLFTRKAIERLGLAPLTSMFQFGENDHRVADDWRQEIHDNDGLSMWTGRGEWIWRPLVNPPQLRVSWFQDENPKGFGLLQRDRDFDHYQDEGAQYERRPSAWIEPGGDWGKGAVQLVEIPTADETFDNIVAFWNPAEPVQAGAEIELAYKLYWCVEPPVRSDLAKCIATRTGKGGIIGHPSKPPMRKFVVDFAGGDLPLLPKGAPVEPIITLSRGRIEHLTALDGRIQISPLARPVPEIGGWRITFDLSWEGTDPIDIRMFLKIGPTTLTETWLYQWSPPA
jgi:glucans biosynthesis protein